VICVDSRIRRKEGKAIPPITAASVLKGKPF